LRDAAGFFAPFADVQARAAAVADDSEGDALLEGFYGPLARALDDLERAVGDLSAPLRRRR